MLPPAVSVRTPTSSRTLAYAGRGKSAALGPLARCLATVLDTATSAGAPTPARPAYSPDTPRHPQVIPPRSPPAALSYTPSGRRISPPLTGTAPTTLGSRRQSTHALYTCDSKIAVEFCAVGSPSIRRYLRNADERIRIQDVGRLVKTVSHLRGLTGRVRAPLSPKRSIQGFLFPRAQEQPNH